MSYVRFPARDTWHKSGSRKHGEDYTACWLKIPEGAEHTDHDDAPPEEETCWNCLSGQEWTEYNPGAYDRGFASPLAFFVTIEEWEHLGRRLGIDYSRLPRRRRDQRCQHRVVEHPRLDGVTICVLCGLARTVGRMRQVS